MVFDAALLNIQHNKLIKGKVEQSSALYTAIEMGAFGSPATKVVNFILLHRLVFFFILVL